MENYITIEKQSQEALTAEKDEKERREQEQEPVLFGSLDMPYNKYNSIDSTPKSKRRSKPETNDAKEIKKLYSEYVKNLKNEVILLKDREDPTQGQAIFPYFASRYSQQGRKKMAAKMQEKYDYVAGGVFVTITFEHSMTIPRAWKYLKKHLSEFLNKMTIYSERERKRRKEKIIKIEYIWAIEGQPLSGYPHLHIFVPNVSRLFDYKVLRKIWKGGRIVDIRQEKGVNIGEYMSKYLTKQQGMDDCLPFAWYYGVRLYGATVKPVELREKPKDKIYEVVGRCHIKYDGDSNVPDIETLALSNGIKKVGFFGSRGGGMSIYVDLLDECPEKEWFEKIFVLPKRDEADELEWGFCEHR